MVAKSIYQLKITLKHTKPPIWRRVEVLEAMSLSGLHAVIQDTMGWYDCHLHEFDVGGRRFGVPCEEDDWYDSQITDESGVALKAVFSGKKSKIGYLYDFGDGWDHEILLEDKLEPEEGATYPRCIKGKLACPPEDCGGIGGYYHLLEAMKNPNDSDNKELLEWLGDDYKPNEFDLDEVNEILGQG